MKKHKLSYYRKLNNGPYLLNGIPYWLEVQEGGIHVMPLAIQDEPIDALLWLIHSVIKPTFTMAEVGVWCGETLLHYAPTIKNLNGKIYAIDWFKGNEGHDSPRTLKGGDRHAYDNDENQMMLTEQRLQHNLKAANIEDTVEILKGDSVAMSKHIRDNSLDLCFIDADHTYKGVKRDIEAYLPKVKEGGIICGHDCLDINLANTFTDEQINSHYLQLDEKTGCHPGVIQAVYDSFGEEVVVIPCQTIGIPIWAKRKGSDKTYINMIPRQPMSPN